MVRVNAITHGVTDADVLVKLETFNPGNSIKDRIAVKMIEDAEREGKLTARRHDRRGHLRQHRHGPGHCRGGEGLPLRLHHHRQAVEGKDRRAQSIWRRGASCVRPTSIPRIRGRTTQCRPGWRARFPARGRRTSTTTRRTPQAHYEQTAPEIWDQTDGKVDAPGGRRRHRRHDQRHRQVSEGTQPGDQGVGHRHLRIGLQEIQRDRHLRQERDLSVRHRGHRRRLPAGQRRLRHHRPLREGHRQGRGDHDAAAGARGGHLRRQLRRRGDGRCGAARRPLQEG